MKVSAIIDIARNQYLDDAKLPYEWTDVYLAQCATEAEKEACKRAKLIMDKSTQTAANLVTSTTTSTSANKLSDSAGAFTSVYLGKTVYNNTTKAFATITNVDSAILLSLSSDIMLTGQSYTIGDANQALTAICVVSGTSDYKMSGKTLKIIDCYLNSSGLPLQQKTKNWLDKFYYKWRTATGTPKFYIEEKGFITLVPQPDSTLNNSTGKDMLYLSVYRLPLNDLTLVADNSPEIPDEYHFDLVFWMCHLAYTKQDADALDLNKSQWHEGQFERKFGAKLSAHDETVMRLMTTDFTLDNGSFGIYNTSNY